MNTPSNFNLRIPSPTLSYSELKNWSSSSQSTFNSSPSIETLSQYDSLPLEVQRKDDIIHPSSPCNPSIYQDDEDTHQYSWPYYAPERVSMVSISDGRNQANSPWEPKIYQNHLGNGWPPTSLSPETQEEMHSPPRHSILIKSPTSFERPAHQVPSPKPRPLSNGKEKATMTSPDPRPTSSSFQRVDSAFFEMPLNTCLFYPPQIVAIIPALAVDDKPYNIQHGTRNSQASYAEERRSRPLPSPMKVKGKPFFVQTAEASATRRESEQARRMKETSRWVEDTVATFAVGNEAATINKKPGHFDRLDAAATIRVQFVGNSERDIQRRKRDEEFVTRREPTGRQLATDREDLEQLRKVTEKMAQELRDAQELLTRLDDERIQKEQMIQEQEVALRCREDELKKQEADLTMQQQLIHQQLSSLATTNDNFAPTSHQVAGFNLETAMSSERKHGPKPAPSVHSMLSSVSTMSSISTVKSSNFVTPKTQWDLYLESKNGPPPYVDPNATNRVNLPSPSKKVPDSSQSQSRRPHKLQLWIPPVSRSHRSLPAVPVSAHPTASTPMIMVTSKEKRGKTNEPPVSRLSVIHETY